jgi:hypothetical protein
VPIEDQERVLANLNTIIQTQRVQREAQARADEAVKAKADAQRAKREQNDRNTAEALKFHQAAEAEDRKRRREATAAPVVQAHKERLNEYAEDVRQMEEYMEYAAEHGIDLGLHNASSDPEDEDDEARRKRAKEDAEAAEMDRENALAQLDAIRMAFVFGGTFTHNGHTVTIESLVGDNGDMSEVDRAAEALIAAKHPASYVNKVAQIGVRAFNAERAEHTKAQKVAQKRIAASLRTHTTERRRLQKLIDARNAKRAEVRRIAPLRAEHLRAVAGRHRLDNLGARKLSSVTRAVNNTLAYDPATLFPSQLPSSAELTPLERVKKKFGLKSGHRTTPQKKKVGELVEALSRTKRARRKLKTEGWEGVRGALSGVMAENVDKRVRYDNAASAEYARITRRFFPEAVEGYPVEQGNWSPGELERLEEEAEDAAAAPRAPGKRRRKTRVDPIHHPAVPDFQMPAAAPPREIPRRTAAAIAENPPPGLQEVLQREAVAAAAQQQRVAAAEARRLTEQRQREAAATEGNRRRLLAAMQAAGQAPLPVAPPVPPVRAAAPAPAPAPARAPAPAPAPAPVQNQHMKLRPGQILRERSPGPLSQAKSASQTSADSAHDGIVADRLSQSESNDGFDRYAEMPPLGPTPASQRSKAASQRSAASEVPPPPFDDQPVPENERRQHAEWRQQMAELAALPKVVVPQATEPGQGFLRAGLVRLAAIPEQTPTSQSVASQPVSILPSPVQDDSMEGVDPLQWRSRRTGVPDSNPDLVAAPWVRNARLPRLPAAKADIPLSEEFPLPTARSRPSPIDLVSSSSPPVVELTTSHPSLSGIESSNTTRSLPPELQAARPPPGGVVGVARKQRTERNQLSSPPEADRVRTRQAELCEELRSHYVRWRYDPSERLRLPDGPNDNNYHARESDRIIRELMDLGRLSPELLQYEDGWPSDDAPASSPGVPPPARLSRDTPPTDLMETPLDPIYNVSTQLLPPEASTQKASTQKASTQKASTQMPAGQATPAQVDAAFENELHAIASQVSRESAPSAASIPILPTEYNPATPDFTLHERRVSSGTTPSTSSTERSPATASERLGSVFTPASIPVLPSQQYKTPSPSPTQRRLPGIPESTPASTPSWFVSTPGSRSEHGGLTPDTDDLEHAAEDDMMRDAPGYHADDMNGPWDSIDQRMHDDDVTERGLAEPQFKPPGTRLRYPASNNSHLASADDDTRDAPATLPLTGSPGSSRGSDATVAVQSQDVPQTQDRVTPRVQSQPASTQPVRSQDAPTQLVRTQDADTQPLASQDMPPGLDPPYIDPSQEQLNAYLLELNAQLDQEEADLQASTPEGGGFTSGLSTAPTDPLEAEMAHSLSEDEIRALVKEPITVCRYPDLSRYRTAQEVLNNPSRSAAVLFLTTSGTDGHWMAFFENAGGLHVFDPLGGKLDSELHKITPAKRVALGQTRPEFTRLFSTFDGPKFVSHYDFQDDEPGVNTCGRWVALRIHKRDMSDADFKAFVMASAKAANLSMDEWITTVT